MQDPDEKTILDNEKIILDNERTILDNEEINHDHIDSPGVPVPSNPVPPVGDPQDSPKNHNTLFIILIIISCLIIAGCVLYFIFIYPRSKTPEPAPEPPRIEQTDSLSTT